MKISATYDVIVIGVGAMGSATCYFLARQGVRVLGIEQFDIPNTLSSHVGQTRIIRKAYFEHPDYVPLLDKAYQNWAALESESGEHIYFKTGMLYAGPADHLVLQGVKNSAATFDIPLQETTPAGIKGQYPPLDLPEAYQVCVEPEAGFLLPEKAISAYVKLARQYGAGIRSNTCVTSWRKINSDFEVTTPAGTYLTKKLIFTAGPWTSRVLAQSFARLTVTRQVLAWVKTKNYHALSLGAFPCWMIAQQDVPGVYYGFPILPSDAFHGPSGFKLAYHYPGEPTDPDSINRMPNHQDELQLVEFLQQFFPNEYEGTIDMKICMYTNSADEHFILDSIPDYGQDVLVAAGFSGHGFKFASVIGEILKDLVCRNATDLKIDFLRARRFRLE